MTNRKSVVGAGVTAFIWLAVAAFLYMMRSTDYFIITMSVMVALTFAFSYNLLQSLDEGDAHKAQTRIEQFLKSLDEAERSALSERVGGGEYVSVSEPLVENAAKSKRR